MNCAAKMTDALRLSLCRSLGYMSVALLAGGLGSAQADQVNLGTISFDNLIPAGSSPGTNGFDIFNYTGGANNILPDFPVADDLTFDASSLILTGTQPDPSNPGSTIPLSETVLLGDLGPGTLQDVFGFPPFALQFPDTFSFSQAEFKGTLSSTTFALANGGSLANGSLYPDGSSFAADSSSIDVFLSPSIGNNLIAGTDSAVFSVSGTVSTQATPEPASDSVLLVLLLGIGGWAYKRQKTRSI
jgi:hypothetical protein